MKKSHVLLVSLLLAILCKVWSIKSTLGIISSQSKDRWLHWRIQQLSWPNISHVDAEERELESHCLFFWLRSEVSIFSWSSSIISSYWICYVTIPEVWQKEEEHNRACREVRWFIRAYDNDQNLYWREFSKSLVIKHTPGMSIWDQVPIMITNTT